MQERPDSARILRVLDHPARRRVIELLGKRGAMPWKDLAGELGMGTGALYYHLDTLEGIVVRDESKKYALTGRGREVYEYLEANPLANSLKGVPLARQSAGGMKRYFEILFAPRPFLSRILSSDSKAAAFLLISSVALLLIMSYLGREALLFYLTPSTNVLGIVGGYTLSLLTLFFLGYISAIALFRAHANPLPLAASSAFSFLPVVLFSALLAAIPSFSTLLANRSLLTIVLLLVQTWSATIFAAGISVSSGLRIEKSALVSLVALYATMAIILL